MPDASRRARLSQEAKPRRFVTDVFFADDLQCHGAAEIDVDDSQVGGGYGIATPASTEAMEMVARREGILLDPVYTAKAMAGLIARLRAGAFSSGTTVLFWHTGGQVGFFA